MKSLPALALSCLKLRVANGHTALASGYQAVFCYFSEKHFGCSALKKRNLQSSFIPGNQEPEFIGSEIIVQLC